MKIRILFLLLAAIACSKPDVTAEQDVPAPPSPKPAPEYVYSFSEVGKVFGFEGNRYAYCPSVMVMPDGSRRMFFCGNPNPDVFIDNIYALTISGGTVGPVSNVLRPGLSWDSRHNCDPCVVKGRFKMSGITYSYALFFLSNPLEYYYNEIGVAFSNDLVSWVKYPEQLIRKPWDTPGDLYYSDTGKCWGVGQPSAISLDKGGRLLLTYTQGDLSGTRVVWREIDLSDMSSPVIGPIHNMLAANLLDLNGKTDWTCNCDFAYSPEEGILLMVRPVQPHSSVYPAFIPSAQEIDFIGFNEFKTGDGRWTSLGRIDQSLSGFARNHNSCIERDEYGYVPDYRTPTVYFTVSGEYPQVVETPGSFAEWSYTIHKVSIVKREVERCSR